MYDLTLSLAPDPVARPRPRMSVNVSPIQGVQL